MNKVESLIIQFITKQIGIDKDEIQLASPFENYGLTSSHLVSLMRFLEKECKRSLDLTLAWQYPSIEALSAHILRMGHAVDSNLLGNELNEIAIIGMACKFPGAKDLKEFWQLCWEKTDAITEVPSDRWSVDHFYDPNPSAKGKIYTRWGGFLENLHEFDGSFFGISPREAIHLDPRQRLVLEASWEAFLDAGITPGQLRGSNTGVFIATLNDDYGKLVFSDYNRIEAYSGSGTAHSMIANRISYFYDFHGPSIALDTACSGSLVAVHLAMQSLRNGECPVAIAGGVNVLLNPDSSIFFSRAHALSRDGRCKTFDAKADGFVRSEGVGIVILKSLSDAIRDDDRIYALVKGSAINQDGRTNGTMAPNPQAQEAVLRMAYRNAQVSPSQLQYIELHGTGTKIGDPIEAKALSSVLSEGRPSNFQCLVGSVKTNIGHTESAAGIAGVIKTSLAIYHKKLPGNLHFQNLNPLIPSKQLPFRVNVTSGSWPDMTQELIAGVSSFGFGGTNGHVVLASAPKSANRTPRAMPIQNWKKKRYWIERDQKKRSSLLGNYFHPVKIPSLHVWETNCSKNEQVSDHKISGEIVFPGAGYIELVLTALENRGTHLPIGLRNIQFLQKMKLPLNDSVQLSLIEEPEKTQFEIHSAKTSFAKGIVTAASSTPNQRNLSSIFANCPNVFSLESHYKSMSAHGIDYGLSFQSLDDIRLGKSEAIAKIHLPVHNPMMISLDALFQLVSPLGNTNQKNRAYLPFAIEKFEYFQKPTSATLYGYAFLEEKDETLKAHLELLDSSGHVLAFVKSFQLHPIIKPSNLTYSLAWEKATKLDHTNLKKNKNISIQEKNWLIFGKKEGLSEKLKKILIEKGAYVIQVENTADFQSKGATLFSEKFNVIGLDTEKFNEILALTQICIKAKVSPSLCLVTRGAQSVHNETISLESAYQSLVWGLGRTAMHIEHPILNGKLIDLDPKEKNRAVEAINILEMFNDVEDQIVLRHNIRYRSRLSKFSLPDHPPITFNSSGAYLITGGLGQLGLSIAQWMFNQGARHLILLGMNPLPDRNQWETIEQTHSRYNAIQTILSLEAHGCEIEVVSLDISDFDALCSFYEQRKQEKHTKIRGVIHAAGVNRDVQLYQTKQEHIKAIFPSKVQGAFNLFTLLKKESLDFVLFFSSLSSILPLIGQGIYAAANAFLDAFVHFLRGLNIPAFSVNWGPVQIGMASRLEKQDIHTRRGMFPLTPAKCWDIVGNLLQGNHNSLVVTSADWNVVYRSRAYIPPMIQEIESKAMQFKTKELVQHQNDFTIEKLKKFTSKVLQIPEEEIDPKKSLTQMGLDSLMATELKNLLATNLNLQLSISDLLQKTSLEEIILRSHNESFQAATEGHQTHDKLPLSYPQEGIWFLKKSNPNLCFNIAGIVTHKGNFNPSEFYHAVDRVVESQTSLRTAFYEEEGIPYQKVLPPLPTKNMFIDLSSLSTEKQTEECNRIFSEEAKKPFDLEKGYLLRIVCVKISNQEHRVLVVMHHIISDGLSTHVLMHDVFSALHSQNLPKLPMQYSDYAIWQQKNEKQMENGIAFWKETFKTLPDPLNLSINKANENSFVGKRVAFAVSEKLVIQLKEYCKKQQCTPFMVLFAVYAILLQKYCSQETYAIGIIVAGREKKDLEGLIGCFINTLPILIHLRQELTFREFLTQIKKTLLKAYDHANVPFEKILRELKVPRDFFVSPIFQTVFSFERDPTDNFPEEGVHFEEVHLGTSRYNLSLELTLSKKGLNGWFDFKTDLFEQSTIEKMSEHFLILLNNVLKQNEAPISKLELFSEEEKKKILFDWNQTQTPYPRDSSIYDLFLTHVNLSPQSIAVEDEECKLTYNELNLHVNSFSKKLEELGIGHGKCVGLCANRSIELIITILSLLKRGVRYVPIDQRQPLDRIQYILQSAEVSFLLTDPFNFGLLETIELPHLILEKPSLTRKVVDIQMQSDVIATDIACILYTSGSTGVPKGVSISHRNILRLVCNTNYGNLGPKESFLLFAPISFDAALFEIWGALLNGGRLVIAPPQLIGLDELANFVQQHQISTLWLTAALFQNMDEEVMKTLTSLRQLLVGGDVVSKVKVEQFLRVLPSCRLINGYGPTEGTTFSCCHTIQLEDLRNGSIPIGKPTSNTQVYILDSYLNPTPIGVPGEIYIGGDGVVSGYIKNPQLDKERFIQNPFIEDSSNYIYRTGDRGWFLPDGKIKFGGRFDRQVKLRGFRIELEEIEMHLRAHPNVQDVVVILHKDSNLGDHICAYIAPDKSQNDKELKTFLKHRLPDYMIPTFFMFLPKIPLTDRGKIDHEILPLPQLKHHNKLEYDNEQVDGEIDPVLAEIWKKLLHLEKIDRKGNFFELGGDSIIALQFVSHARRKGFSFTVQDVFAEQTLEKIAKRTSSMSVQPYRNPLTGIVPLTPIQQWFFQKSIPNPSLWNQWVLFTLPSTFTDFSLNTLIERHDCFYLRFRKRGMHWEQYFVEKSGVEVSTLKIASILPKLRKEVLFKAINEEQGKLDLENGPLFRFLFIEGLENNSHHLLIVAHHLVIDQVSWYVLLNEIEILCETKNDLTLAPFSRSFAEWSYYLQEQKQNSLLQEESLFWQSIPWEQAKNIPLDKPEGSNLEGDAKTIETIFETSLTRELKLSYGHLNDFLAAVLIRTLQKWNGNHSICIDLEQSGRLNTFDIHHTVGWFTQIYPVFFESNIPFRVIKERLRDFSKHGFSFGLFNANNKKFEGKPQVIFNFLGEMDKQVSSIAQFGVATDPLIQNRDPKAQRSHWLEINALILEDRLHIFWIFSPRLHHSKTISYLAEQFKANLKDQISEKTLLPVDFPFSPLKQSDLNHLNKQCKQVEDIYTLTPMQEGLLLHSFLHPMSDKYLVQCILELEGPLDIDRFKQSWLLVLKRHPVLRTGFHSEHLEHPVQVVEPLNSIEWHEVESSRFESIIQEDRCQFFDLSTPLLMRFFVAKMGRRKTRFLWTYHHILLDGWSMAIVLLDLFTIYEALIKGKQPLLPDLLSFKQFIASLSPQTQSINEWRSFLKGFNQPTPLPLDMEKGTVSHSPKELLFDPKTSAALTNKLSKKGLTMATFIQGIWALVLSHFSKENDIVFGVTVSGRHIDLPEVESVVGLCINTVPQRVKIDRKENLYTWLEKIQASQIRMQPYQQVPLSMIQKNTTLFQSVVVIENYPINYEQEKNSSIKLVSIETKEKVEYPLTLIVLPGDQLCFRLLFDESRFSDEGIQHILNKIESLISCILKNWDCQIGELLPLSRKDLETALQEVWSELLGVKKVGMQEHFHELGGNSLITMRMRGRLQQRLGIDISLVDLLKAPTINSLIELILSFNPQDEAFTHAKKRGKKRRSVKR
jgi:amino acid adenylation domain-containing protein/non-ribosomal peptide synthase protein (TIGR01720 family)